MKRSRKTLVIPSLIIAAGMILATYIAHLDKAGSWKASAAMALMASAVVGADAVRALIVGGTFVISLSSVLMGSGFVLASLICRSSQQATQMIITLSGISWVLYVSRPRPRHATCRLN